MAIPTSILSQLPQSPGIYKFYDKNRRIIYIGKAINLKKRINSYFQKGGHLLKTEIMVSQIVSVEYIQVNSEFEALLLESDLIKAYKPKYNVIWKDDKHYIYISITAEEFPKVLFARRQDKPQDNYYGPYPSSGVVKQIIALLRRIIPFCTQKDIGKRACFYSHIGLCSPCPGDIIKLSASRYKIQKNIYRRNISYLKMILKGGFRVKKEMEKEMKSCTEIERYEEAAQIRDRIQKLTYLFSHYHTPQSFIKNPDSIIQIRINEQKELSAIMNTYITQSNLPKNIECYDISNISGKFAAGSLVTFIDGEPAKEYYRRFRIKTKSTPDDFFMLREVFSRRLKHKDWVLPELFIVDGGIPQVSAMYKVLQDYDIHIPLIGLAKRDEQIIIPSGDKYITLTLNRNSGALRLIQRLRDEAHRFAHRYHEYLRLKYLLPTHVRN